MALIIEDGSGVAGADSFATVAEARTWAASRGLTLPDDDGEVEVLLRKAADKMNSLEDRYQGYRLYDDQTLCLPRECIYVFNKYVGGTIPQIAKDGQCQLAVDANTNNLLAAGNGREITEKKVGPLTTKWSATGNTSPQYNPTAALSILDPLFIVGSGSGINLLSYR